jgi:hypothetical protein
LAGISFEHAVTPTLALATAPARTPLPNLNHHFFTSVGSFGCSRIIFSEIAFFVDA